MSKYDAKDIVTLSPGRASKNSIKEIGKIYIIKNNINNKVYIGQTINSLSYRFNQHARVPLKKCSKDSIDYAIKSLGIENFFIELLEECPISELDTKEVYWINFYDSYNNGYNLTRGGQFSRINKISEDILIKIIKDYKNEIPVKEICQKYNINKTTLYRHFKNNNVELLGNHREKSLEQSIKNLKKATEAKQVKIYNKSLNIIYSSKKEALCDMIKKGFSKAIDWHNIRSGLDRALKNNTTFLNFEWEVYYG